jgi:N-acetylmuramoyl-L-alanine amidase
MPDVWLPGAYRDPGVNAGYNAGHSTMQRAVAHYTVGQDSRNSGRDGYCHFVVHKDVSRENGCTQYAEINAVTWHAANQGNPYGPGIEWERMTTGGQNDEGLSNADPLTDNQIAWGQKLVAFLAEWGIPAELYNGPRFGGDVMPGGNYCGWVNHHDLDDQRTDGLLRAEWDQIAGGSAPAPAPVEEDDMLVLLITDGQNKGSVWIVTEYSYWSTTTAKLSPGRSLAVTWNEAQPYFDDTNRKRDALGLRPMGT